MTLGKSLRLRRIFANGRALVVPLDHRTDDPVPLVRSIARSGVDAVALSPGVLERVIEDLAGLAVVLRLNGSKRTPQLVSVQGALELAAVGVLTGADKTNREYIGDDISIDGSVDKAMGRLLYDPQTAGGMLISIAEDRSQALLERLQENYPTPRMIGRVTEKASHSIIVER